MGVTVRDASLTTARRRYLTQIYAKRNGDGGAGQAGDNSQSINLGAILGGQLIGQTSATCACTPDVTLQGYDKKSPAK
jgi:hypothetical protein